MKPEDLKFLFIILGTAFTIFAIVSGFFVKFYDKKIKDNEKDKTSIEGIFGFPQSANKKDYFTVLLGQGSVMYSMDLLQKRKSINPFYDAHGIDFPLIISITDRPLVSATFRSFDNKVIAILENNEWKINPNNCFDRNYDSSTLEVIDMYNIPVLQIEFINEYTILLKGVYYSEEDLLVINEKGPIISNGAITLDMILKQSKSLKKVFNYPSSNHLGERVLEDSEFVKALKKQNTYKNKKVSDKELVEKSELIYEWVFKYSDKNIYAEVNWESVLNEYYTNYKLDAIYFRNELYRRTEIDKPNREGENAMYEFPTNHHGMRIIANDLRFIIDEFNKSRN